MTDRMRDDPLDHEIRAFLTWQAGDIAGAPTATEMALRISDRASSRTIGVRMTSGLVWLVVLVLVTAAIVGAAVIGALSRRAVDLPLQTSYEAIFLRGEVTGRSSANLLVIGIDAAGHEREITRLPAGCCPGRVWTMGTVSQSGLLLVPRDGTGALWHYEVVDLRHSDAAPIVVAGIEQDSEQIPGTPYYDTDRRPATFWGPAERVAIPWYDRTALGNVWHVAFVDGRTGTSASVGLPDDLVLLPDWTSDGSGILLARRGAITQPASAVLRQDGTVGDLTLTIAPSIYSRHYRSDGALISAVDGRVAAIDRNAGSAPPLSVNGAEIVDVAWAARDGIWLVLRSGEERRDLRIERRVPISAVQTVATIVDGGEEPVGSRPKGHFVGLAPDDSMIVLSLDRVTGTADNGSTTPVGKAALVTLGGASFVTEGTFAGWLESDS